MIAVLLAELSRDWEERLRAELGEQALVLRAENAAHAADLAWSARLSLLIFGWEALTRARLEQYGQLVAAAPQAVKVCVAPDAVREHARREGLLQPDVWLSPDADMAEVREVCRLVLDQASTRSRPGPPASAGAAWYGAARAPESPPAESKLLERLMAGLAGGLDLERLLGAYTAALVEFTHCASYALLWRERGGERFSVKGAQGLPPEIVAQASLRSGDYLPTWYRRHSRLLTRRELGEWAERGLAAGLEEELTLFRAQVALPVWVEGRLTGIMLLGDKALGEPYLRVELETLFLLTNYVGLQARSLELHAELWQSRAHLERILAGMSTGVVTLTPAGTIALCNPAAARILRLPRGDLQGADLRVLPSPLGDYLYGVLQAPEETVSGEEVSVLGGEITLRVSTSPLLDEQGQCTGSVLLMEDLTPEIALATERQRRERLDLLNQIIGRLAHEVRTPLTAIKTYAELAGRTHANQELAEFWSQTVFPQIERLDTMVTQLVQLVQQPEPNFELVRLEHLAAQAAERVRAALPEVPAPQLEVREHLPRVVADPEPTREALQYLLRHLIGRDGAAVQMLVAHEVTELGESVRVTLTRRTPDGKGVEPDMLFDPLHVLREAGADLGPVISRKIIENQGGRVQASSEDGMLQFMLTMPASAIDRLRDSESSARRSSER